MRPLGYKPASELTFSMRFATSIALLFLAKILRWLSLAVRVFCFLTTPSVDWPSSQANIASTGSRIGSEYESIIETSEQQLIGENCRMDAINSFTASSVELG